MLYPHLQLVSSVLPATILYRARLLRTANLLNALNQLVDALTGLERILTTPIPFSYALRPVFFDHI